MKFILLFFFLSVAALGSCEDELKHVIVLFRHGDRNKIEDIPGDLHTKPEEWPGGYGELVKAGKQRHYRMGQYFRKRYDGFLPARYSKFDTYVRSSDVDRTLMSAASHLAGLYPPSDNEKFDAKINWLPIPIHTVPEKLDNLIAMRKHCSKYEQLFKAFNETSKTMLDYYKEGKEVVDVVFKNTNQTLYSVEDFTLFYDTLLIEQKRGMSIPDWVKDIYPDKLDKLSKYFFYYRSFTPELARFQVGPLIDYIVKDFKNASDHSDASYQKYKILSGHDNTIGSLLHALGAAKDIRPPYSTAVIIELRKKGDKHVVNLLLKDTTDVDNYENDPVPLTIKFDKVECDFDCDLDKFVELVEGIRLGPEEWEVECENGKPITTTVSPPTTTTGSTTTTASSPTTTASSPTTASSTTTASPSTTTASPSTTTASPSTATASPSTTTASPSTTSVSPSTTASPSTTTASPSTTTASPSTTTASSPTTTDSPSTTTASPSTTTDSPSTTTASQSSTTVSSDKGWKLWNDVAKKQENIKEWDTLSW